MEENKFEKKQLEELQKYITEDIEKTLELENKKKYPNGEPGRGYSKIEKIHKDLRKVR